MADSPRIVARCVVALAVAAIAPVALAQSETPQFVVYTDGDDLNAPLRRTVTDTAISSAAELTNLGADVRRVLTVTSPTEDRIALLTEDSAGALRVRFRIEGVWTADETIAPDVSGADTRGFDACFEHRSGDLLLAYRRAGESDVYLRTHDGALSVEMSVNLSFAGTPERIRIAPDVAADNALLIACAGARLAAARWTGSAIADTLTLDSVYDNDPRAWDAVITPAESEPIILWARSGDSAARMRHYTDDTWQPEAPGPSAGDDIRRIALAYDPSKGGADVLAGLATIGGAETFRTSFWSDDAWSATDEMTTTLAGVGDFPMAIAFEGDAGAALAVWREEGDNRLRSRRWNGAAWSVATLSSPINTDVVALHARPWSNQPGVVTLARRAVPTGLDPWRAYAIYSEGGTIDVASNASVTGQTGVNEPGVSLPSEPAASAGSTNLSYGNNDDETIVPGQYKALSVGQNVTLRLSAGEYVFTEFDSNKNGTHFVCDTTAGDIEFILTAGDFKVNNGLKIERLGDNEVFIHVLDGDFISQHNETIDAVISVHNGSIDIGNSANISGHLLASDDITVGMASAVAIPATQSLVAVLYDEGAPGAPATLNATPWAGAWPMPMDVSSRTGQKSFRIIEWAEVPAYDGP